MTTPVLVAGATGDLGHRIVRELRALDAHVRVLTRPGSDSSRRQFADDDGVDIVEANYSDPAALQSAIAGAHTVVSALSGIRPVILDAQRALLHAATSAGVKHFIPSDFSADYRRIERDSNRNFELRREFAAELDAGPLRATSVLNGMFTDLLTGVAPLILFTRGRVLFWSDPDQILDFTTKDDTARFTAQVALDDDAPRVVEIAGDRVTARDIAATMTEITGHRFKLQWAGTTSTLGAMARIGRRADRKEEDTFPAWQGMQYFVSMFSGQAQLRHVANDRYGVQTWTAVRDVLQEHVRQDS